MNRLLVMDGHCDTVYRCWSMGEELPCNTGALELSSVLVWKKFQPFSRAAGRFLEEFRNMLDEYTGA